MTKKDHKNISQDRRFPGRDFNLGLSNPRHLRSEVYAAGMRKPRLAYRAFWSETREIQKRVGARDLDKKTILK
jgi:hypothetical protein